jgi:hypothetical protein
MFSTETIVSEEHSVTMIVKLVVIVMMIVMMIVNIARDGRALGIKLEMMELSWESNEAQFQGSFGS